MPKFDSIELYVLAAALALIFIWFCGFDARRRARKLTKVGEKDRAELEDSFRKTTAQIIGAGAVVLTFAYTLTKDDLTLEQTRAQAAASTYAEAVKLLNEDATQVQTAGIYLIERVAALRSEYRDPIAHTLVAFVRAATPSEKPSKAKEVNSAVGAAVRVLGRTATISAAQSQTLNLERTNLAGADFSYLQGFAGNKLNNADLRHANFEFTNLTGTELSGTEMNDSGAYGPTFNEEVPLRKEWSWEKNWYAAKFDCADLSGAQLDNSGLVGAIFGRANLKATNFEGAVLSRADFTQARELESARFKNACADTTPSFPEGFECPLRKCNEPPRGEPASCKFKSGPPTISKCPAISKYALR